MLGYDAARDWGRHFFTCSYCQIDLDDYTKDRFCPEGMRRRDKVLATPENRAYLIRMADEWAQDEWHRADSTSRIGRAMVEATNAERGPRVYSTEELGARERRFMDAKLP